LLTLERGRATIEEVLERLGPRDKEITPGAVWVILERAIQNGLVSSDRHLEGSKKPYFFWLTDGGKRRIVWIKGRLGRKVKPELRAIANPKVEEED